MSAYKYFHWYQKPPRGTPLNVYHSLARGLIGYWPFLEGTGAIAKDLSGLKNDGAIVNQPLWLNGRKGFSLQFVNTNTTYVNCSSIRETNGVNKISVSYWEYPRSFVSGAARVTKLDPSPFENGWAVQGIGTTADLRFSARNASSSHNATTTTLPIVLNTWNHVVMTYDGTMATDATKFRAFHNTNEITLTYTATMPSSIAANTVRVFIGAFDFASPSNLYDGLIDDVRIYNRALSLVEIKCIYRNPYDIFVPPGISKFPDWLSMIAAFNAATVPATNISQPYPRKKKVAAY